MPWIVCVAVVMSVACLAALAGQACGQVEIVERPAAPAGLPAIPWVKSGDTEWLKAAPLFRLGDASPDGSAEGWVAAGDEDILLHVVVRDDVHHNDKSGADIWNGDALQLGIDARGDGSGSMDPKTRAMFGPDDAAMTFALTSKGPAGWVHFSQGGALHDALPANLFSIRRDEPAKTTTYDIHLPWKMLSTAPGLYPTIGLAVQINDDDGDGRPQRRLYFGRGADGVPAPGLFQRLALQGPVGHCAAAEDGPGVLWDPADAGEIYLVVGADAEQVLRASLGEAKAEKRVPGDGKCRRFIVRGRPASPAQALGMKLEASVGPAGGAPAVSRSLELVVPQAVYQTVVDRLASEVAKAKPPLLARHLQSVQALVQVEWARLLLYRPSDPLVANLTLGRLQDILAGLQDNAAQWQTYLDGKRELILAYLSRRDQTLQYYQIGLPKDWDPAKEYPLFVELHGAGDANPLNGVAAQIGGKQNAPNLAGYSAPITFAGLQRRGYHVQPFGRGNTGYRDIGETDVWEALADFDRSFKTDPNRRYLYGFSMGGGGTWALGSRTPDKWAAIAIFSPGGGRRAAGEEGLGRNVAGLPIWMWCGQKDGLLANTEHIRDEIARYGPAPVFSTTPDVGHNYLGDKQAEAINWLQQHTRQRPATFEFLADTDEHRGVWGITLTRDVSISGRPSLACKIEGNTVSLKTQGTPSVEINMGPEGLGLSGEVTVILNGKEACRGPAAVKTFAVQTQEK